MRFRILRLSDGRGPKSEANISDFSRVKITGTNNNDNEAQHLTYFIIICT